MEENKHGSTAAWIIVAIIVVLLLLLCAAYNEIVKSHQSNDAANLKISALTAELKTLKEKSNDRPADNPVPHSDAHASCKTGTEWRTIRTPHGDVRAKIEYENYGGKCEEFITEYSTPASGLLPQRDSGIAECPQVDEARIRAAAELAEQIVSEVRASQE